MMDLANQEAAIHDEVKVERRRIRFRNRYAIQERVRSVVDRPARIGILKKNARNVPVATKTTNAYALISPSINDQ